MTSVDPRSILAALGVHATVDVQPVSGGWDTALWQVDAAHGRRYALRVFRPEQAPRSHREALVMRWMARLGLPVPSVAAESSDAACPALLLDWCPGQPLLDVGRSQPWRLWQMGVLMGRLHARLHALPVPSELLEALPRVSLDPQPDAEHSLAVLHLDYHPLNLMTDARHITGFLDWANVAVGDRRADLARTVTLLRLAPLPPGTPVALMVFARQVLEAGWRQGYRVSPFRGSSDPFKSLAPFYVWAGRRMEQDMRPKLGRPGVWLQEADLERIHAWTEAQSRTCVL